nr:MAG TPA: hypothetical protein [Caudoviricetes sp.]
MADDLCCFTHVIHPLSIVFPCYNSVAIIGFAFSSVTANSFFVVRKQPFGI